MREAERVDKPLIIEKGSGWTNYRVGMEFYVIGFFFDVVYGSGFAVV